MQPFPPHYCARLPVCLSGWFGLLLFVIIVLLKKRRLLYLFKSQTLYDLAFVYLTATPLSVYSLSLSLSLCSAPHITLPRRPPHISPLPDYHLYGSQSSPYSFILNARSPRPFPSRVSNLWTAPSTLLAVLPASCCASPTRVPPSTSNRCGHVMLCWG